MLGWFFSKIWMFSRWSVESGENWVWNEQKASETKSDLISNLKSSSIKGIGELFTILEDELRSWVLKYTEWDWKNWKKLVMIETSVNMKKLLEEKWYIVNCRMIRRTDWDRFDWYFVKNKRKWGISTPSQVGYFAWIIYDDEDSESLNRFIFVLPFYKAQGEPIKDWTNRNMLMIVQDWDNWETYKEINFIYEDNAEILDQLKDLIEVSKSFSAKVKIRDKNWKVIKEEDHIIALGKKMITYTEDERNTTKTIDPINEKLIRQKMVIIDFSIPKVIFIADSIKIKVEDWKYIVDAVKNYMNWRQSLEIIVNDALSISDEDNLFLKPTGSF